MDTKSTSPEVCPHCNGARYVPSEGVTVMLLPCSACAESAFAGLQPEIPEPRESLGLGPWADSARARIGELERERERLRAVVEAFAETAEAAVRHHETKPLGGQQVTFSGDFASLPPSAVSRLRWWAREMRAALAPSREGDR